MAVINGTPGDDHLVGTPSGDQIDGKAGNDVILGLAGNDSILGGDGDDLVDGGDGDDVIDAGNGADTVFGGSGDDVIDGGAGDDIIDAGGGDDVVGGGDGQDHILGGSGDDVVVGDAGNDFVAGGTGDDEVEGGSGDDQLFGEDGDDVLRGDTGNDSLSGGAGDDRLYGGQGDDTLAGNQGDDRLYGGTGDDKLIVSGGDDKAYGGLGSDTFYVSPGDHRIIGGEDPDGKDIDVLDLSASGNYTVQHTGPEAGIIHFFDPQGKPTHNARFKEIERIICFTPGTGIATMQGDCKVEDLRVGDRVFTRDNGAQEICWIGRKKISLGAGSLSQNLQPILLRKGALGYGLPDRDILVSPNHRVLLTNKEAQLYFGETEVLVAAKHLLGMPGVEHWITSTIEYVHFLCERHEIVLSNGAWTESFQPGEYSMTALGEQQRDEIYRLFPELKTREKVNSFAAARRSLKRYEAELLTG